MGTFSLDIDGWRAFKPLAPLSWIPHLIAEHSATVLDQIDVVMRVAEDPEVDHMPPHQRCHVAHEVWG